MYVSIHDVKDFAIKETQNLTEGRGFCRTIYFKDAKGNQFEINLFAADAIDLAHREAGADTARRARNQDVRG